MFNKAQTRALFLSSMGGVLEFYDFIIYALLASYIAADFFKTTNALVSLIATFATFSVGYLVRPIGGIIFGHFGDKYGRKKTFTLSILIMAVSTFAIGLVPTYAQLGPAAPILLTILRIFQGLSVGGEIPGSIVYVSEMLPQKKNLACGIIFCALISGIALGFFTQAILTSLLSSQHMQQWGWRVPFFIGGIFGFFSYKLRRKLEETHIFKTIIHDVEVLPIIKVLQLHLPNTLAGIGIVAWGASLISLLFLFIPSFIKSVLKINDSNFLWLSALAIFLTALLCIVFGFIADYCNRKKLLLIASLLTIISAYPIFTLYTHYFNISSIALLLSALITGFSFGVMPGFLTELYPARIRYSGVAITYNLGFAIFGGLTPLISMLLIYKTHLNSAPMFYLMFTGLLCLLALLISKHRPIES